MGGFVLRGITTALLVTVLTLFAGIIWNAMGSSGLSVSRLVDIGLFLSCLVGGYRAAKESGVWLMGGVTGAGYVIVGTLLLALFLPIRGLGFLQVLAEGALIGLVAGAIGAGAKARVGSAWTTRAGRKSQSYFAPSYVGYSTDDRPSSEFDWGTEDVLKGDSEENQGAKKNPDTSSNIVWPWDRENKKNNIQKASKIEKSELPEMWEPELVPFDNEFADWNRGQEDKVGKKKANKDKGNSDEICSEKRPWWE